MRSAAAVLGLIEAAPTADLITSFRAMATEVTVRVSGGAGRAESDVRQVQALFGEVESQCTRFDPESPLMRANAAGGRWHRVPQFCFEALSEAADAYRATGGLFDPRVLRVLHALGYDWSFPVESDEESLGGLPGQRGPGSQPLLRESWLPEFDARQRAVRLGPEPIDLGGIGKGLAVRWAAEMLAETWPSFLITAGGDCYLAGGGPDGVGWQVGVEDPRAAERHVAVLNISGAGCATSSTRVRRWTTTAGQSVHHLIDPRTDAPGAGGLSAVTVVGPDTAVCEVWSKVLFLHGSDGIAEAATAHGLAALWITEDGSVGISDAMTDLVIWQAAA